MVHSPLDAVAPTSAPSSSFSRLDLPRTNHLSLPRRSLPTPHSATETVVAQQLSTMEIDTRLSGGLRHRLFPRAMAWNVHQTAQHLEPSASYPADEQAYYNPPLKAPKRHATSSPLATQHPHDMDGRERLFRTVGKWLDQRPTEAHDERFYPHAQSYNYPAQPPSSYEYDSRAAYVSAPVARPSYEAPLPRNGNGSIYDMVKLHQLGHHSPTYAASLSSHPSPTHSHSSDGSHSKKRQRGPSGSTVPPTTSGGVARPGMSTSSAKRCSVQDCGKIAVSKGLCRGHGGGRRCTFAGCTKCAQSRSPFCWAHGGGKRCEAPNCRRSRKTKRFCVDHVDMELTVPLGTSTDSDSDQRSHASTDTTVASNSFASSGVAAPHNIAALNLPSLTDALKRVVPTALARASSQTVTLPQSRDRLWPAAQPFH